MIKSMSIRFAGFNGFGQIKTLKKISNGFEEARIEYVSTTGSELESFDISCTWNYLAFAADNVLNLSGFIGDQLGQSRRITFECNVKAVASSEKYCLVLLTSGVLYKVEINSLKTTELNWLMIGSEPAPKKKSIFGAVSNQESMNRSSNEKITLVASGRTMSVALSNLNVLYNIPSKTFTFAPHVKVKKMCCGNEHCLILTTNGDVYAFGSSSRGQLGIGSLETEEQPVLLEALAGIKIIDIAAGGWHSAAISAFNDLYVWGWNVNGQLGLPIYREIESDTSMERRDKIKNATVFVSPTLVDLPNQNSCDNDEMSRQLTAERVFAGERHTVVSTGESVILSAGWNKYRQLGHVSEVEIQDTFTTLDTFTSAEFHSIICGDWSTIFVPNV